VVAGIVAANIFGLRMFQVNQTRLKATEWARTTLGKISDEVHYCDTLYIGNMTTNGAFAGLLDGEAQQGGSLLIYPTTNTTHFIVYYINPADQTFRRATEQSGSAVILADSITNRIVFSAQNFAGYVLTNSTGTRLVHLKLEFVQPQRFMRQPDYYKLETSITRRSLN
jgi:hypothetical protein